MKRKRSDDLLFPSSLLIQLTWVGLAITLAPIQSESNATTLDLISLLAYAQGDISLQTIKHWNSLDVVGSDGQKRAYVILQLIFVYSTLS